MGLWHYGAVLPIGLLPLSTIVNETEHRIRGGDDSSGESFSTTSALKRGRRNLP
jgi:hypothetical protein